MRKAKAESESGRSLEMQTQAYSGEEPGGVSTAHRSGRGVLTFYSLSHNEQTGRCVPDGAGKLPRGEIYLSS